MGPNGQRVMSQQQAAEIYAVQQYQSVYLSLVTVLTADALRKLHPDEDWKSTDEKQKLDTDWICDTAQLVAVEAMKRLGISVTPQGSKS